MSAFYQYCGKTDEIDFLSVPQKICIYLIFMHWYFRNMSLCLKVIVLNCNFCFYVFLIQLLFFYVCCILCNVYLWSNILVLFRWLPNSIAFLAYTIFIIIYCESIKYIVLTGESFYSIIFRCTVFSECVYQLLFVIHLFYVVKITMNTNLP